MTPLDPSLLLASLALAGLGIVVTAALAGWRWWLEFRRAELDRIAPPPAAPSATARIEIADLKERIRRLEAIAAGVDL